MTGFTVGVVERLALVDTDGAKEKIVEGEGDDEKEPLDPLLLSTICGGIFGWGGGRGWG